MSKATELRLLQNQRSIDAPINYHHRSGDSEGSAGNMLDRYAQTENAEEEYFESEEEGAREVFARAFRLYLKKTLTGKERKFLKGILAGKETPSAIGKALGVKWFECLQEIQRKAFNNAEAFGRVVQLSGWSRAQEFSETVFKRLEALRAGAELNELLPQNKKYKMFRQKDRERKREYYIYNREKVCKYVREYYFEHREKVLQSQTEWRKKHPNYRKEYYNAHREELQAYSREYAEKHETEISEYRKKNGEKLAALQRERYAENRELERERMRECYARHRAERQAHDSNYRAMHREEINEKARARRMADREKINEKARAYCEAHRGEVNAKARKYRESHREEIKARARERYAKKKAAKALAELMQTSQQESQNNQAHTE